METDPIAARLSAAYPDLPPGERAIVRVLLDDHPFAALGSLRGLAERAGVSPPTASRLFDRLGYAGFADFQSAVRDGARDRSRLLEYVTSSETTASAGTGLPGTASATATPSSADTGLTGRRGAGGRRSPKDKGGADNISAGDPGRSGVSAGPGIGDHPGGGARAGAAARAEAEVSGDGAEVRAGSEVWQAAEDLRAGLDGTLTGVPEPLYHKAAELLAGAGTVWALGGPLSELAAEYLIRQLASLRPRAHRVPESAPARARTVLDLTPADVIVAYDFRRYSPDTARFVHAARGRGTRLVLVTDAWGSPLAAEAELLIRLPREAAGPIAPLAHEIAVTELLLVATATRLAPAKRLADLDELTQTL